MLTAWLGLLPALLLLPAPVQAERVQLPCKVPTRGDYRLTNAQQGWSRDGKPWTVTVTQTLHFDRDTAGSRLTLGVIRARSDLDPSAQQRLSAAFGSTLHEPMTLLLDERGQIVRVEELEHHWQVYLGRIEQVARDMEAAGQSGARARATLAALARADEPTRIGIVASQIGPLLRHCGQSVEAVGEDGMAVVATRTDTPDLTETARFRLDALTGLARDVERTVVAKARPGQPQTEHWRYEPLP